MAGARIERRLHPGHALLGCKGRDLPIHLSRKESLEERNVGPGFAVLAIEQSALDPSQQGSSGENFPPSAVLATDEPQEWHGGPKEGDENDNPGLRALPLLERGFRPGRT
jgi:hypothetical protein